MLAQRSTHYWLWFILFGVISALVDFFHRAGPTAETWWLLATGLIGVVVGSRVFSSVTKPFDIVVGILFTGVGLLGILHNFGVTFGTANSSFFGVISNNGILGLSFALAYALIHTLLGLTSLNNGLRARSAASPSVVVEPRAAA